jgi:hypothetical protein
MPRDCGWGDVVKVLTLTDELLEFGATKLPPRRGVNETPALEEIARNLLIGRDGQI